MLARFKVRSWKSISQQVEALYDPPDYVSGPTNSHATKRIINANGAQSNEKSPSRVILFRDHHAWCPYCQKVWLFMEEKGINYEIRKVTMFCYGEKEAWYKKIVPRGMLPALVFEYPNNKQEVITESDVLLERLEETFGPLNGRSMHDPEVMNYRRLERELFRAWCQYLCYPCRSMKEENKGKDQFTAVCREFEDRVRSTGDTGFLMQDFSISDVIFAPYLERMQSSIFYYKGFNIRKEHPYIEKWFSAMESRPCYRGTKSDHHTHVHDLPPQMGGCYFSPGSEMEMQSVAEAVALVDEPTPDKVIRNEVNDETFPEPKSSRLEVCYRVLMHKEGMSKINPVKGPAFDVSLRAVLTKILEDSTANESDQQEDVETLDVLPSGGSQALLWIRDRLSIPRDMSLWAGRRFRSTLTAVATQYGNAKDLQEYRQNNRWRIPVEHRRDSDPKNFGK